MLRSFAFGLGAVVGFAVGAGLGYCAYIGQQARTELLNVLEVVAVGQPPEPTAEEWDAFLASIQLKGA